MNQLQSWCEASRLGIPILVSMDSVHGTSYVGGALVHPHNLGLAATRDVRSGAQAHGATAKSTWPSVCA